jgi:hypothetical protein
MKPFILLAVIFLASAGCGKITESSDAYIQWASTQVHANDEGVALLPVKLADGESAKLVIGASYTSGSKFGRSSAEVSIQREGSELILVGNGNGGAPLVWLQERGATIACTKTLSDLIDPVTYIFKIALENCENGGSRDATSRRS